MAQTRSNSPGGFAPRTPRPGGAGPPPRGAAPSGSPPPGAAPPNVLRTRRAALLADTALTGADLRLTLSGLHDAWLTDLLAGARHRAPGVEVALAAVGGLGREEMAPYSDLDLVLVHDGAPAVAAVAAALWYPIWDSGVGLDHSVRTVPEAKGVAERDAKVALGLLDVRHVAGAAWLSNSLRATAYDVWRAKATTHLPALAESLALRHRTVGELAFLLEPDLKESLGGLRDAVVLHALAVAQLVDEPAPAVVAARTLLLDVRGELHRGAGRSLDRLVAQEQERIAVAVGRADADDLLRAVSAAGRTIRFASETAWRTVTAELARRGRWRSRRRPDRRPMAEGIVEYGGEIMLARAAEPAWDAGLVLRAAAAAASARLPISPFTLRRLGEQAPELPVPWPEPVRDSLIRLLGTGHAAVPVIEALDQHGLMARLLPAWEHVRALPQRNPVHRFTVDRHLVECAAEASALTRRVARPDLLLLAALLHDIGKGRPGDHSEVGAGIAYEIGERIGLMPADVDVLVRLVRHHLLLPNIATRRDPDDPATVDAVVAAVRGSRDELDLLHALCVADARATGPAAWSEWKAALVSGLVERARGAMTGTPYGPPELPEEARLAARMDRATITPLRWPGVVAVERFDPADDGAGELVVVAPDTPGLLSRLAGLFAVHGLDIVTATVTTQGTKAVNVFRVAARFGRVADLQVLRADFEALLADRFSLAARLAAAERSYPAAAHADDALVLWFDGQASAATVVEVRAADSIGLLHRLTTALERCRLDVRSARISTLGGSVVDAFSVTTSSGALVTDPELRRTVEAALLAATNAAEGDGGVGHSKGSE